MRERSNLINAEQITLSHHVEIFRLFMQHTVFRNQLLQYAKTTFGTFYFKVFVFIADVSESYLTEVKLQSYTVGVKMLRTQICFVYAQGQSFQRKGNKSNVSSSIQIIVT